MASSGSLRVKVLSVNKEKYYPRTTILTGLLNYQFHRKKKIISPSSKNRSFLRNLILNDPFDPK